MSKEAFVTTYKPIAGWKAVMYWWNPEGFWEPWDTSPFAFPNETAAAAWGRAWAADEGVRFLETGENP